MYSIGLCLDERYLLPALTTIMSTARALGPRDRRSVGVRVLTNRLSRLDAATVEEFCGRLGFGSFNLRWKQPSQFLPLIDDSYITKATYLRFDFTPNFVRDPYFIYLDADALVLEDISSPLNDIRAGALGAVRDQFNPTIGQCPALPGLATDFPIHHGKPYFNAGALWMEAILMPVIRTGIHGAALTAAKYIKHNDQDALNMWLLDGLPVTTIPAAYNRFELSRFLESGDWVRRVVGDAQPPKETSILHFVGPTKPWQSKCPATAAVRDYRFFLRETRALLRRMRLSL